MCEMVVFSLSVLNLFYNILSCMGTGPLNDVLDGQRLAHALISRKTSVDFVTCVKHCVRMRSCRSVNYMENFLLCELNYKNTTNMDAKMTATLNAVYSERIHWNENQLLSDACKRMSCPNNTECIEDQSNHASCVVADCGLPRTKKNSKYDLQNGIGLYSKVTYDCEKDYYMEGKPYIGCQDDGKWSPVRFGCFPVCDTGWKHYSRYCYRIPELKVIFDEAKVHCEEADATLADVLSKEENDFILALRNEGQRLLLLGGRYYSDVFEWRWLKTNVTFDGRGARTLLYTNWDTNEPNHLDRRWKELCMGISYSNKWHNWHCSWKTNFVCKKNARM